MIIYCLHFAVSLQVSSTPVWIHQTLPTHDLFSILCQSLSSASSHSLIKANKALHYLPMVLRKKSNLPNIIFKNQVPVFVSSFISHLSFHHSCALHSVILKVISSLRYAPSFPLPRTWPVLFFSCLEHFFSTSTSLCPPPRKHHTYFFTWLISPQL